jgi:hypothetical protein
MVKRAVCGCEFESEGDMPMVRYCDKCRPAASVDGYLCICGLVFKTFEELQDHAYNTDCLFPVIREEVAA